MNYFKIYDALVAKRRANPLVKSSSQKCRLETHHIKPRSLGGSNDPDNLINLTVREHIFAHELLYLGFKRMPNRDEVAFGKMCTALLLTMFGHSDPDRMAIRRFSSRVIAKMREDVGRQLNARLNDMIVITDGHQELIIRKDADIPFGWEFSHFANPGTRGKVWINNGIEQHLVFEDQIPNGFIRGQIKDESKRGGRIITDGVRSIILRPGELLPDGFRYGRPTESKLKGDRVFNNGKTMIRLKPDELVPDGFRPGYLNKKKKQIFINDGKRNRYIYEDEPIPEGWVRGQMKGRFQWITDGTECRRLHTGEPMPEGFRKVTTEFHSNMGKIAITDGKTHTFISPGDPIPTGWKLGSSAHSVKGRTYYNNGKVQMTVKPGEPIPEGFVKGKLPYVFINNGKVTKKILPGSSLPVGFKFGWIRKSHKAS